MGDLCAECRMPEGLHTSDCPIRLERKTVQRDGMMKIIADLVKWRDDPDVKLILAAAMKRQDVDDLSGLSNEMLTDLHEAIELLLAESPTITTPGDPRRMV